MNEASASSSTSGNGYVPGPTVDYVQDLESVGLGLSNWLTCAKVNDNCASNAPLVFRSWSDKAMGIFGTDTLKSLVEIDAEATQDLLAFGVPLGDEDPLFRVGNLPFTGQGLDIICLPRGSRLQLSTRQNGLRSVALLINIDTLPAMFGSADSELPSVVRKMRRDRAPLLAKASLPVTIKRIAQDVVDAPVTTFQRLYRRAKMGELLWLVMNHLRRGDFGQSADRAIGARALEGLERVRRLLEEHAGQDVTTEQLARIAAMNRTKLRSLFKCVYGMTIFDYRQALIMKQADEMLRQPNFTVSEIGYRLGYREPSSFSIAYKRLYGHSPAEIRRQR